MVPYCSCCLCLYFGSSIMLVTYFVFFCNFFTDRSKAVLLLWFIVICYNIYNVCLFHDFVATLRLSALPSALYFLLSKLAL